MVEGQQSPDFNQLTVVIVTFNSAHCVPVLGVALQGIQNIIVVDNASHDGTQEVVARHLPQARLVANARNLGFGAANNIALGQLTTPFALLLNPDCEIKPDEISQLLEAARQYAGFAIIVPQIVSPAEVPEINYRWPSPDWASSGPGAEGPCCVGFVCGAAMLFNMQVMREVGFFDETFFLYYEDDDLCKRVFDQKKEMLVFPSVRVIHRSRGSVGGKHQWRSEYLRGYHHAQSKIRFAGKYQNPDRAQHLKARTLGLALLALPFRLLLPVPRHLARLVGRIAGLWQFDSGRPS